MRFSLLPLLIFHDTVNHTGFHLLWLGVNTILLQKVRQVMHCLIRLTLQLITLKCTPSPSDHLEMMINESVRYFSHSALYCPALLMWVTNCRGGIVHRSSNPGRLLRSCFAHHKTGVEVMLVVLFFLSFFFFVWWSLHSSFKSQLHCGGRQCWETAHIKIQVQGREDEPSSSWACRTTCEIVVWQWLLSQLIIELGKRSIVPVRWSNFQLAAYWDSNLWQY